MSISFFFFFFLFVFFSNRDRDWDQDRESGSGRTKKKNMEWTPLDEAIARGKLEIAQSLFENGRRPNLEKYRDGVWTPVHDAAKYEYATTLEWVFENKVLPLRTLNIKDQDKWTPLDVAIAFGKLETAKCLWDNMGGRPNLDEVYCDGKWTPVHDAAKYATILEWAFKENILPLSVLQNKNRSGCTPLDKAISENQWETASLLRRLMYVDPVFLAMQRAKRDHNHQCVLLLRRLPTELLDMVVDEVAARHGLQVVW